MKTVFGSNSQLAHVWAQQNQEHGKANNFFFNGSRLYSYGSHFVAGQIHTVKGHTFAVTNSTRYSNSTCRHLSYARSALRGLMHYFESPDPTDLRCTRQYLDSLPILEMERLLKVKKVDSTHTINSWLNYVTLLENKADEFRGIVGLKSLKRDIKMRVKVLDHLKARLKRYKELNTPAMIQARQDKKQKEIEKRLEKNIATFRAGGYVRLNLPFDLLRKSDDRIITSRGAEVPFDRAERIYFLVKRGLSIKGEEIGNFTAIGVKSHGKDKVVKIGCHNVLLSEAAKIFE